MEASVVASSRKRSFIKSAGRPESEKKLGLVSKTLGFYGIFSEIGLLGIFDFNECPHLYLDGCVLKEDLDIPQGFVKGSSVMCICDLIGNQICLKLKGIRDSTDGEVAIHYYFSLTGKPMVSTKEPYNDEEYLKSGLNEIFTEWDFLNFSTRKGFRNPILRFWPCVFKESFTQNPILTNASTSSFVEWDVMKGKMKAFDHIDRGEGQEKKPTLIEEFEIKITILKFKKMCDCDQGEEEEEEEGDYEWE